MASFEAAQNLRLTINTSRDCTSNALPKTFKLVTNGACYACSGPHIENCHCSGYDVDLRYVVACRNISTIFVKTGSSCCRDFGFADPR